MVESKGFLLLKREEVFIPVNLTITNLLSYTYIIY